MTAAAALASALRVQIGRTLEHLEEDTERGPEWPTGDLSSMQLALMNQLIIMGVLALLLDGPT